MHSFAFLKRPKTLGLLIAILASITGIGLWSRLAPAPAAEVVAPSAIPVETAIATRNAVPIYLEGLGTVQAYNTVVVTTRVDGQLQSLSFKEGQDVKAGEVLAQIDPRPYQAALGQAIAAKIKDEAQLADAKLDFHRYNALAAQNAISLQTLDTQGALVAQLQAQIQVDQALIDAGKTTLNYTSIRSPIDGRTGIRQVDAGNNLLASANTGIVVVTQLRPISVIFTLPEEDLLAVSEGMAQAPLVAIALYRDDKTELDRGVLTVLDNQINQASGTVRLKASFPNSKMTLWPGDFVNTKLLVRTEANALTVPAAAVQRGPASLYVYVVKPDKTVETRPIILEQFDAAMAVIQSGLREGEIVVTGGEYRLQPGAHVEAPVPAVSISSRAAAQ